MHKAKMFEILRIKGAADVGFCRFEAVKDRLISCRALKRLPENAKSIIVAVFPYKVRKEKPENICRYAAVPDYHTVCGDILNAAAEELKTLFPENRFEAFVDNSPLPEVFVAAKAGLGKIGDNGLLIHKKYGSFVFLGEIVTDLEFDIEDKRIEHCRHCGKCKTLCPVVLEKENCLSKISQQKQDLTPEQCDLLKRSGCVWGCDICAESCPENEGKDLTEIEEFIVGYRHRYEKGEDIQNRAYAWRGEGVISRNFDLFKSKQ